MALTHIHLTDTCPQIPSRFLCLWNIIDTMNLPGGGSSIYGSFLFLLVTIIQNSKWVLITPGVIPGQ